MDDSVDDEAVVGMVEARRPGWTVEALERRVGRYVLARRADAVAAMPLWHERVRAPRAATDARPPTGRTSGGTSEAL